MARVKIVTVVELAKYFGLHRNTVGGHVRGCGYDLRYTGDLIGCIIWLWERYGSRRDLGDG